MRRSRNNRGFLLTETARLCRKIEPPSSPRSHLRRLIDTSRLRLTVKNKDPRLRGDDIVEKNASG